MTREGFKKPVERDVFVTLDLMKGLGEWEYWTGQTNIITLANRLKFDAKGWMEDADAGFGLARDFLINQLETDLLPDWQKGRIVADKYGLNFMVYEGGALLLNQVHNADPVLTDFAINQHR